MKRALTKFFTFVGALVITLSLLGWAIGFYKYEQSLHLPNHIVLQVDLTQPLTETSGGGLLDSLTGDKEGVQVMDLVRTLDRARRDGRVAGAVLRFGSEQPTLARAQEVRDAIVRFKQAGKFTIAYAASFGELTPGDRAYWLAAQCDQIWLQPGGLVGLSGLAADLPFARGLLDQYGIKPDVLTRKAYKTAFSTATDKSLTSQNREMMSDLLDNLYGQLVDGIATGRRLDDAQVRKLIDGGPEGAQDAFANHLIDVIGYPDQAIDAAKKKAGLGAKDDLTDWNHYAYATDHRSPHEIPDAAPASKSIALIRLTGLIHQGESVEGALGGFETSGADTISDALDDARQNDDVKAVVLRIDSPGGSAIASETIRRAVQRIEQTGKPVIVSMGATAASGGYWVATGARTIIANPATLTGSIGVVAGKFAIGDFLKRFNITTERLQRGQNAAMWSALTPFSDGERAKLNTLLDSVYADFKDRVKQARGLDDATVEALAQGRVWTGAEAKERKLVDELGGLDLAMRRAKEKIGVDIDTPAHLVILPEEPSKTDRLLQLLHTGLGSLDMLTGLNTMLHGLSVELPSAPSGAVQMPDLRLN